MESWFNWLTQHPQAVLWALAGTAFIESFAIIGVIVPGVVMLFGLATLANHLDIPLLWVVLATAFGASLAEISSFFIGIYIQPTIHNARSLKNHRTRLQQAEIFFHRWGWLSLLIGRFIGPLRPLLPMMAGTLKFPKAWFIGISLVSVWLWAPAYTLPGYLTGQMLSFNRPLLLIAFFIGLIGYLLYQHRQKRPTWLAKRLDIPALCALVALTLLSYVYLLIKVGL